MRTRDVSRLIASSQNEVAVLSRKLQVVAMIPGYPDVKVFWSPTRQRSLVQAWELMISHANLPEVALEIVGLINKECSAIKVASFASCCLVGGIADGLNKHAAGAG